MMEQQEPYMPPCCIDRKLPALLRNQGTAFFMSQGDWGLGKLWHAASLMVSSREPVFTLLVMEQIDDKSVQVIKQNLAMNWIQGIAIVTEQDNTALISKHLSEFIDRVWYVGGRAEAANGRGLWLRTNGTASLTVMGPIHHADGFKYPCQYAARFIMQPATDQTEPLTLLAKDKQTIMPYRGILRLHATIRGTDQVFKQYL